ncbi:MAG: TRAP transporter 4TM/12TM fusion protein [Gammaproteobacteria bacterium]|jgi:TRAP transporter 4TM/12TM fusion protein
MLLTSNSGTEKSSIHSSRIIDLAAFILTCSSIAWALNLYDRMFGIVLYQEQFLAGVYALVLFIIYLAFPAVRHQPKITIPWYDKIFASMGLFAAGYLCWSFPQLSELIAQRPLDGMVTALLLVPLTFEALRRTSGWALPVIVFIFVIYGLFAHFVPGVFEGFYNAWDRLFYYLIWDSGSLLGAPIMISITVVIPYIFFGQILYRAGGADFFSDFSVALMGRFRGGSAKISIVSSALFGTISGSAVSNVVTTGIITIPMMRKNGFPTHLAAAIEAVASTGGQLMPPLMGASAFLMAEFLQIPYSAVITAAVIPAILYFMAIFIIADLEAARREILPVKEEDIPEIWSVLRKGWHYPIALIILISALFIFNLRPEEAVLWGIVSLIPSSMLFGYGELKFKWQDLFTSTTKTGLMVVEIIVITAAVGFIVAVINISGLGSALTEILVELAGGNKLFILIMAAVASVVLGLGMPTVAVYGLLAILVAPALIEIGITPLGAHLFVIYFGMMSMITPPVAVAAFAAASVAQADNIKTSLAAMRFGWVAYVVPFMFVFEPNVLMQGSPLNILLVFITAISGVWLISSAFSGYLFAKLSRFERIAFLCTGVVLFIGIFSGAKVIDILGLCLTLILFVYLFFNKGKSSLA